MSIWQKNICKKSCWKNVGEIDYWWSSEFITAKLFFVSCDSLGTAGTFYLYALNSILALIFVQIFIKETKNKSLAEIQQIYLGKANVDENEGLSPLNLSVPTSEDKKSETHC